MITILGPITEWDPELGLLHDRVIEEILREVRAA